MASHGFPTSSDGRGVNYWDELLRVLRMSRRGRSRSRDDQQSSSDSGSSRASSEGRFRVVTQPPQEWIRDQSYQYPEGAHLPAPPLSPVYTSALNAEARWLGGSAEFQGVQFAVSQFAKAHEVVDPRGLKVEEVTKYEVRVLARRLGESFSKGLLEQWEELVARKRISDSGDSSGQLPDTVLPQTQSAFVKGLM